jgi:hypothetical protein
MINNAFEHHSVCGFQQNNTIISGDGIMHQMSFTNKHQQQTSYAGMHSSHQ